jgi:hypothetical protein
LKITQFALEVTSKEAALPASRITDMTFEMGSSYAYGRALFKNHSK